MELWDVYDERRRRTGRTHVRGVPLRPGEYHLVVFAWIYNARGEILLTLRDPQKPSYPNTWACTGGSAKPPRRFRSSRTFSSLYRSCFL